MYDKIETMFVMNYDSRFLPPLLRQITMATIRGFPQYDELGNAICVANKFLTANLMAPTEIPIKMQAFDPSQLSLK